MTLQARIAIVDYERSNLYNVERALHFIGAKNVLTANKAADLFAADKVILPGVGAFGDAMNRLKKTGMSQAVIDFIQTGKPLLGICLGMQLLLEESEEHGIHKGLGVIPGRVRHFRDFVKDDRVKVPHIGWSELCPANQAGSHDCNGWEGTVFQNVERKTCFYFIHSYVSVPSNPEDWFSVTEYGGYSFCSVIKRNNVLGCQFHLERSGEAGLQLLKNFVCMPWEEINGET